MIGMMVIIVIAIFNPCEVTLLNPARGVSMSVFVANVENSRYCSACNFSAITQYISVSSNTFLSVEFVFLSFDLLKKHLYYRNKDIGF